MKEYICVIKIKSIYSVSGAATALDTLFIGEDKEVFSCEIENIGISTRDNND